MGTKTSLAIGADISERNFDTREDELFRASVGLTYQFSQRLSLRAEAIHASQERKESSSFDYDENQVRFYLTAGF